jgi:VWFA-related protein
MKNKADHFHTKYFLQKIICFGCFGFCLMASVKSQENPVPKSDSAQKETRQRNVKFRIAVDEVRIDAVVMDKTGRQITNLKADDFEIYQDGKPQKIISCTYINDYIAPPEKKSVVSKDSVTAPPSIPTPMLPMEKVRRIIVFVVDDINMSFQNTYYARVALRKFVERQMQPDDLVSILKTSAGTGALQLFSSDKRQLLSMIKNIGWAYNFQPDKCRSGG